MRRLALEAGVPDSASCWTRRLNTERTVANLRGRFARVLAVSHYYHNARIKLTAAGWHRVLHRACAKPPVVAEPYFFARECEPT